MLARDAATPANQGPGVPPDTDRVRPILRSALVSLRHVGLAVGATRILSDVSVTLHAGAPCLLLGPNGAGKTSLLKLAMGLIEPSQGEVAEFGRHPGEPLRKAFVFQRPVMLRRTASANVAFALAAAGRPADRATVADLLRQVGLEGMENRPARRLSGGEQQRLALARALARKPDILFLDEPTASLDPAATKAVEAIVASVAAGGVAIVMATHDLGQARRLAGDVLFLAGGRLVEAAPAASFFVEPSTEAARRFLAGDLVL